MTIDELLAREAIRDTMARYTMAGDRLRADDFVAAFTPDGILASEHVAPEDAFRYEGHAALRSWFTRWRQNDDPAAPRATFARHHLATCQIDLTGADTARARTYWVAYTDIGEDHGGYYIDDFRKGRRTLADRASPRAAGLARGEQPVPHGGLQFALGAAHPFAASIGCAADG